MPKPIFSMDVYGNEIQVYDHKDTPLCEICELELRGTNYEGLGPRRADLITSTEQAVANRQRHSWAHIRKIFVSERTLNKLAHPRPKGLKPGQAFACKPCYNVYRDAIQYVKEQSENLNALYNVRSKKKVKL